MIMRHSVSLGHCHSYLPLLISHLSRSSTRLSKPSLETSSHSNAFLRVFITDSNPLDMSVTPKSAHQHALDTLMSRFLAQLTILKVVSIRVKHQEFFLKALLPSKDSLTTLHPTRIITSNEPRSRPSLALSDIEMLVNLFPNIVELIIDWHQLETPFSHIPWLRALGHCRNLRRLMFKRSFGSKTDKFRSLPEHLQNTFAQDYKKCVVHSLFTMKQGVSLESCGYVRETGQLIPITGTWDIVGV